MGFGSGLPSVFKDPLSQVGLKSLISSGSGFVFIEKFRRFGRAEPGFRSVGQDSVQLAQAEARSEAEGWSGDNWTESWTTDRDPGGAGAKTPEFRVTLFLAQWKSFRPDWAPRVGP